MKRLEGDLLIECAEWVAEQMEEEGYFLSGDLVEQVLLIEREEGLQGLPGGLDSAAGALLAALEARGIQSVPQALTPAIVVNLLDWEDQFLALAGIPRAHS